MVGDPHASSSEPTLGAPHAHFVLHALEDVTSGLWARNDAVGRSLRTGAPRDSDTRETMVCEVMDTALTNSVREALSEAA